MKLKNCGNCNCYFGSGVNNDGPSGICLLALPKCLVHFIADHSDDCDVDIAEMMATRAADESHCICWRKVK